MTRSPFLSLNLRAILFLTCAAAWIVGCEDLKRYLPSGTDQLIEKTTNIGGAVLNRPQFSEADEERMAQENAAKFEQQAKLWDDPLLCKTSMAGAVRDVIPRILAARDRALAMARISCRS